MSAPDPKPARRPRAPIRHVDPEAVRAALLAEPECASCGRPGANAHHLVPKGSPHFGDDVPGNIVALCGSGTSGCHGAFHGSPYTDENGERWSRARVARRIGQNLKRSHVDYVLGKLGDEAGRDYLQRVYHLRV